MNVLEKMRNRLTEIAKIRGDRELTERNVLKVAVAAMETIASSKTQGNRPLTNEQMVSQVKIIVQGNEDVKTILLSVGDTTSESYIKSVLENEILNEYLPKVLSKDEIIILLASQIDVIKEAKTDGQATGVAMKLLKQNGAVDGNVVTEIVKEIRNA